VIAQVDEQLIADYGAGAQVSHLGSRVWLAAKLSSIGRTRWGCCELPALATDGPLLLFAAH
jgi:hypothetical protein